MKKYWILLMAALPMAASTVVIIDFNAKCKRGKLRSALLSELSELARGSGIPYACIHASVNGQTGYKLMIFGFPDALKQRVRNVWGAHCG
ncbi:hypothetical protein P0Y35_13590 [Kiritimatiellaeota bacterium B1221]|nr:hypothetical protein [Kiritimatiellaeota bacterium B1221]